MKIFRQTIIKYKIFYIFLILLTFICVNKISDYFYISKYAEIPENICETNGFRNPEMNDNILYKLKVFSEKNHLDFPKFIATTLLINDFNLRSININKINIRRYNNIYKSVQRNTNSMEYFDSIKAILSDIRYFPVAFDNERTYKFSYEDSFGSARSYNGNYSHEGTDIMAEVNESGIYPIISVSDGIVENVGWLPKGGYRIGIRGKNGGYFYYAHLKENSIIIEKGDEIKAGQLIAYMGDTGYGDEGTTGKFPVHLHFGMYIKTKNYEELAINPYYILKYLENYPVAMDYCKE